MSVTESDQQKTERVSFGELSCPVPLQDYPNINSSKRVEFLDIIIHEAERMTSIIKQAESPFQAAPEVATEMRTLNFKF